MFLLFYSFPYCVVSGTLKLSESAFLKISSVPLHAVGTIPVVVLKKCYFYVTFYVIICTLIFLLQLASGKASVLTEIKFFTTCYSGPKVLPI